MPRQALFAVVSLLLLGALPAVSQDPAQPMEFKSEMFPLQAGKQHRYLVADPKGKGARTVTITVARPEVVEVKRMEPDPDDKKKMREVTVKVRGYALESTSAHRTPQTEVVALLEDGLYRFAALGKEITPPLCILKVPPANGQTWKVQSTTDNQPIEGTFTCEKVDISGASAFKSYSNDLQIGKHKMKVAYYFVPGTGMVRQEVQVGGYDIVMHLAPKQ